MRNFVNKTHIEGYIYEHNLERKVTGEKSKNPGTIYIAGTVSVATDNACTNIIPVHFSYVTATTSKNTENATYTTLNKIIEGTLGSIMGHGKENAACIRIDSAFALNEFYTDKNGQEELVSAKRNEGGFVHVADVLLEDENARNTFECDMLITNVRRVEADEEKDIPEKAIIKGAIFNYSKALLPVEFVTLNPRAIDYFEGLGASPKEPVVTKVRGRQVSETIVKKITEESAFGDPMVKEVKSTRKEFVITWAAPEPFEWDSEDSITAAELNEAITARETYLATMKQRQAEYKAAKQAAVAAPANGGFDF